MVAVGLTAAYVWRGGSVFKWQVRLNRAKSLFAESWPMLLSVMAVMVLMRVDQVMLGQLIGNEAVGIYSAAVRISEIWYFIPFVIVASVFPAIIETKKQSEDIYYERLQKLYDLMVVMAVASCRSDNFRIALAGCFTVWSGIRRSGDGPGDPHLGFDFCFFWYCLGQMDGYRRLSINNVQDASHVTCGKYIFEFYFDSQVWRHGCCCCYGYFILTWPYCFCSFVQKSKKGSNYVYSHVILVSGELSFEYSFCN